jgi:hypothetical protein
LNFVKVYLFIFQQIDNKCRQEVLMKNLVLILLVLPFLAMAQAGVGDGGGTGALKARCLAHDNQIGSFEILVITNFTPVPTPNKSELSVRLIQGGQVVGNYPANKMTPTDPGVKNVIVAGEGLVLSVDPASKTGSLDISSESISASVECDRFDF